jgi:glutamine amidotransferase
VGSAGATMDSLARSKLVGPLRDVVVEQHVPFLGICIGLQLLLDHSEEDDVACLGWVRGTVRRFPSDQVRVPQIGWNAVEPATDHAFLCNQPGGEYFYFVNSYYADVHDPAVVGAWTDYGLRFPSAIATGTIMATQFHLEKSGPAGLALLSRFATHDWSEVVSAPC